MEWTWKKNARAEAAFLKIDQLIALLRSARHWQMLVEDMPQGDRPVMTEEQLDACSAWRAPSPMTCNGSCGRPCRTPTAG